MAFLDKHKAIETHATLLLVLSFIVVTIGGLVSIRSFAASLAAGSEIDVSGGVTAQTRGGFSYGRAGFIEILTGRDLSIPAVDGGYLRPGSTLKGFSGVAGGGGALSLQAQLIQVGGVRRDPGGHHALDHILH